MRTSGANLGLGTTGQILLDESNQLRAACRLRKNPVPVNATAILCLFSCDQRSEENDRYAVQRPIRFDLRRAFDAVLLRHDKIDKHKVGLETAARLNCA